ncbi:MAG: hypothetical protein K6F37_03690 [Lachnospiraceae bacterium]|nr:hypothetical protein [Lachnospiraceae bacterium]
MNNIKKIMCTIFAMAMLVSVSILGSEDVYAVSNTPVNNVVNLGTGGSYTKTWDSESFTNHCFIEFKLNKDGYVNFKVESPVASDGTSKFFDFYIYSKKGKKEVWGHTLNTLKLDTIEYQSCKVGLKKGSYYLEIMPKTWITGTGENLTSAITLSTKADKNYEKESNNTRKTANTLKLGKKITGTYGDEGYFSKNKYQDWYKIKLTKGKTYKFTFKNKSKLKTTTMARILASNQIYDTKGYGNKLLKNGKLLYTPAKSGYYYIQIENYGQSKPYEYTLKVTKK